MHSTLHGLGWAMLYAHLHRSCFAPRPNRCRDDTRPQDGNVVAEDRDTDDGRTMPTVWAKLSLGVGVWAVTH